MKNAPLIATIAGVPVVAIGLAFASQAGPSIGRSVSAQYASTLRGGQCNTTSYYSSTTCDAVTGSYNGNSCGQDETYGTGSNDKNGVNGICVNKTVYCGASWNNNVCTPFGYMTPCGNNQ